MQREDIAVSVVGQPLFNEAVVCCAVDILLRFGQAGQGVVCESIGVAAFAGVPERPFRDITRIGWNGRSLLRVVIVQRCCEAVVPLLCEPSPDVVAQRVG